MRHIPVYSKNKIAIASLGFSLLELMVAMSLGLLLLGGVIQIYLGTKSSYQTSEGLSRLQENMRFATGMITHDLRMAGYIPCGKPLEYDNIINTADSDWWHNIFQAPIRGYESGESNFPDAIKREVAANTDAIAILRGGNKVAGIQYLDRQKFVMQRNLGSDWVEDGSIVIVCDPGYAVIFQAGEIGTQEVGYIDLATGTEQPGNRTGSLEHIFDKGVQASNYQPVIYYIAESSSGSGFSLYREYLNVSKKIYKSKAQELLAGVENMQLLYGVDEQGDDGVVDQYVKASVIEVRNAWDKVKTVKVGMLFASEERMLQLDNTKTYLVAGTSIAPMSDHRKRYTSSFVVNIRNAE